MELLKQIAEAEVQVNLSFPTTYISEIIHHLPSASLCKEKQGGEILSDKINFWNSRVYEVPLDIIDIQEVTIGEYEEIQEGVVEPEKLIYEIPIIGLQTKDKERFITQIEALSSEIQLLLEENSKIKISKETTRIYEVPLIYSEIKEVPVDVTSLDEPCLQLKLETADSKGERFDSEVQTE